MATQEENGDAWMCIVYVTDHNILQEAPIVLDEWKYCVRCNEQRLEPVANGQEHDHTKIGDVALYDFLEVQERVDPELWRRVTEARAFMRAVAPKDRIYCFNPREDGNCNQYLGVRQEFRQDRTHQWTQCPHRQQHVCRACRDCRLESPPSDADDPDRTCVPNADMVDLGGKHDSAEIEIEAGESPWLDSAQRVADLQQEARVIRHLHIEGEREVVKIVKTILLLARQFLALVHNRFSVEEYQHSNRVRQPEDIYERFLFAQLAMSYSFELARLSGREELHRLPVDDTEAPEGPIKWLELYGQVRILQCGGGKPEGVNSEHATEDWRAARALVEKLPLAYDSQANGTEQLDATSVQTRDGTRNIALCLGQIVHLLITCKGADMSASTSFYMQTELRKLQLALNEVDGINSGSFRDAGVDQQFVHDMANFILSRLFEEKFDNITDVSQSGTCIAEMLIVGDEATRGLSLCAHEDMPGRVPELLSNVKLLNDGLMSENDPMALDDEWSTAFRRQRRSLIKPQTNEDPTPGEGTLRPLFLANARCVYDFIREHDLPAAALHTPAASRRSSSGGEPPIEERPPSDRRAPSLPRSVSTDYGELPYDDEPIDWHRSYDRVRELHENAEREDIPRQGDGQPARRRLFLQSLTVLLDNIVNSGWDRSERGLVMERMRHVENMRNAWRGGRDRELFAPETRMELQRLVPQIRLAVRTALDCTDLAVEERGWLYFGRSEDEWWSDSNWIAEQRKELIRQRRPNAIMDDEELIRQQHVDPTMDDNELIRQRNPDPIMDDDEHWAMLTTTQNMLDWSLRNLLEAHVVESSQAVAVLRRAYESWPPGFKDVVWFDGAQSRVERGVQNLLAVVPDRVDDHLHR